MKMYIYFDRNGTIKEVINDESIRRGSSDYNKIYCYLEGNPDIDDIWYLQKNPDGTLTNEVSFVDNIVTKAIPYDAKRDMKYFQDFEEYQFYVFTLSSSYLSQNGLVVATIRVAENNTLWALGELTFNVQANIVKSDNDITQSQYDYLLTIISAYYSKTEIDNKLSLKADKSDTYTKTEVDNKFAPKTTAVTHSGNQLKDYNGNNIYPALEPEIINNNQDWTLTNYSGWVTLANTRRFVINYGNEIPANDTFNLSLQAYYINNLEYTLLVEIWIVNGTTLTKVDSYTYTCPTHSTIGFYENKIIENKKNIYGYPILITVANPNDNAILYAQSIQGNKLYNFSDLSSSTLNLSTISFINGYNFRYYLSYTTDVINNIKDDIDTINGKLNSYVTVKKDGTGDYTTITEALNNVPEGTPIIVYEGVYEENIRMINTAVNIRGVNKNKCVIKSKNGGYDNPTLYVKSGVLKDLTIIAEYVNGESTEIGTSNGAYAVHIESEGSANTTMEIDNCVLRSDFSAAAGIGLRNNSKLIIRDSVLINNQVSGRGSYESNGGLGALYCHDSMGVEGNSKVELYNNLFISNLGSSICLYHVPNKNGNSVNMICTNNVLKDAINGYSNNIWNRNNAFDYFSITVGYDNSNNDLNKYVNAVTLNNIVDSNGNHRFIEGDGTPATITGFTATQCKWSLSGTHLMIVLQGSIANGTTIVATNIAEIKLPSYILQRIGVIYSNVVENKEVTLYALGQNNQIMAITLTKGSTALSMYRGGSTTLNADRNFKVQFDILIDSE